MPATVKVKRVPYYVKVRIDIISAFIKQAVDAVTGWKQEIGNKSRSITPLMWDAIMVWSVLNSEGKHKSINGLKACFLLNDKFKVDNRNLIVEDETNGVLVF